MGDPKKLRKKYQTPAHPWNKTRIEEEKILVKETAGLGTSTKEKAGKKLKGVEDVLKKGKEKLQAGEHGEAFSLFQKAERDAKRSQLLLKAEHDLKIIAPFNGDDREGDDEEEYDDSGKGREE